MELGQKLLTMKVAILHDRIPENASPEQVDTIEQVRFVGELLRENDCNVTNVPFPEAFRPTQEVLRRLAPDVVFNLVESVGGSGRRIHLAPAILERIGIPFTGASTKAQALTSNKLLAKKRLRMHSIPTPDWIGYREGDGGAIPPAFCIIKSVWEHASIGLDEDSVVSSCERAELFSEMKRRLSALGGNCFAEEYIDGREFNLAMVATEHGPIVLPPAEIIFHEYGDTKRRIVGYRAKWSSDSFEYLNTPRTFDFPLADGPLLALLKNLAIKCWRVFSLDGWARVDFRVDGEGRPWVLEINANPCLSPDAGFIAAVQHAGIAPSSVVLSIVEDALHRFARKRNTIESMDEEDDLTFRIEVLPSDVETVRGLCASSGNFSLAEIEVAAELVMERLAKGDASGYYFSFAEEKGRVVGYACYGPIACTEESFDLYWIAVDREHQKRKIGRRLMERSECAVSTMKGSRVYVETSGRPGYHSTRSFYQRCGYDVEAVLKDFYSSGDDKVIFLKRLDGKVCP